MNAKLLEVLKKLGLHEDMAAIKDLMSKGKGPVHGAEHLSRADPAGAVSEAKKRLLKRGGRVAPHAALAGGLTAYAHANRDEE